MTEKKRILLNVVATYGRSLYGLVLGLFCGRWALLALGDIDYGLYGLIGGLTVFIAFFNNILAGANARFYAYSVGAATVALDRGQALEECRQWFNTAFSVHLVIPIVLIVIGYPLGVYAIEHWLTIPIDRVQCCICVFRFTCLSCFVAMINVPFSAMYGAKQYIAELTIYSFVTPTLNFIALYYMVTHPSFWLVKYAAWMCLFTIIPQIVICIRAFHIFPECKIVLRYMWDKYRLRKLGAFSFWQILGTLCSLLRTQGMFIVVNRFFGATMNAAQSIGNSIQGQCFSLASAMQGAFVPVITQACGAKNYKKMNEYIVRVCKFNVILSGIFILPLSLELPEVLCIWLKNPPEFTTGLCYCAIAYHLINACTVGHMVGVNAFGRIANYQIVLSSISIFTLPIAVFVGYLWRNVYCVMSVVVVMEIVNSIGRIVFARLVVGTSVRIWVREVFVALSFALLLSGFFGSLPIMFLDSSFVRVCVTTLVCEIVFLPLVWLFVLSHTEREFLAQKILPLRWIMVRGNT